MRKRDRGGGDIGGPGGHDGTFSSAEAKMGTGSMDVEHGPGGKGRPVMDGLYPRDRTKSLYECVRPGPATQQQPFYCGGLPMQFPIEGARKIPHSSKETATPATDRAHEGGRNLCGPTEGRTKTTRVGTENKRVYLRVEVETC